MKAQPLQDQTPSTSLLVTYLCSTNSGLPARTSSKSSSGRLRPSERGSRAQYLLAPPSWSIRSRVIMNESLVDLSLFEDFPADSPAWHSPYSTPSRHRRLHHQASWEGLDLESPHRGQRHLQASGIPDSLLPRPRRAESAPSLSRCILSKVTRLRLGHSTREHRRNLSPIHQHLTTTSSAPSTPGMRTPADLDYFIPRPSSTAGVPNSPPLSSRPAAPMIWLSEEQMWLVVDDPVDHRLRNPPPRRADNTSRRSPQAESPSHLGFTAFRPHPSRAVSNASSDTDSAVRQQLRTLIDTRPGQTRYRAVTPPLTPRRASTLPPAASTSSTGHAVTPSLQEAMSGLGVALDGIVAAGAGTLAGFGPSVTPPVPGVGLGADLATSAWGTGAESVDGARERWRGRSQVSDAEGRRGESCGSWRSGVSALSESPARSGGCSTSVSEIRTR